MERPRRTFHPNRQAGSGHARSRPDRGGCDRHRCRRHGDRRGALSPPFQWSQARQAGGRHGRQTGLRLGEAGRSAGRRDLRFRDPLNGRGPRRARCLPVRPVARRPVAGQPVSDRHARVVRHHCRDGPGDGWEWRVCGGRLGGARLGGGRLGGGRLGQGLRARRGPSAGLQAPRRGGLGGTGRRDCRRSGRNRPFALRRADRAHGCRCHGGRAARRDRRRDRNVPRVVQAGHRSGRHLRRPGPGWVRPGRDRVRRGRGPRGPGRQGRMGGRRDWTLWDWTLWVPGRWNLMRRDRARCIRGRRDRDGRDGRGARHAVRCGRPGRCGSGRTGPPRFRRTGVGITRCGGVPCGGRRDRRPRCRQPRCRQPRCRQPRCWRFRCGRSRQGRGGDLAGRCREPVRGGRHSRRGSLAGCCRAGKRRPDRDRARPARPGGVRGRCLGGWRRDRLGGRTGHLRRRVPLRGRWCARWSGKLAGDAAAGAPGRGGPLPTVRGGAVRSGVTRLLGGRPGWDLAPHRAGRDGQAGAGLRPGDGGGVREGGASCVRLLVGVGGVRRRGAAGPAWTAGAGTQPRRGREVRGGRRVQAGRRSGRQRRGFRGGLREDVPFRVVILPVQQFPEAQRGRLHLALLLEFRHAVQSGQDVLRDVDRDGRRRPDFLGFRFARAGGAHLRPGLAGQPHRNVVVPGAQQRFEFPALLLAPLAFLRGRHFREDQGRGGVHGRRLCGQRGRLRGQLRGRRV
ncbi:hypothetical protein Ddep01_01878 [Deinococcus depolymerans]